MNCGVVALMGCHAGCGHGGHALVCGSDVGVAAGGPGAEDEDAHCGFGCVFWCLVFGVWGCHWSWFLFFFELLVVVVVAAVVVVQVNKHS